MQCYFENNKNLLSAIEYRDSNYSYNFLFAKNIKDNLDSLEANIDALNVGVYDLTSLYQYIWIESLKKFVGEIEKFNINKDIKIRIIQLSEKIKPIDRTFIEYINNNYELAFTLNSHTEVKRHHVINCLFELVFKKFSNVISDDVFIFIEKTIPNKVLLRFDICGKRYKKKEYFANFQSLFVGLNNTEVFNEDVYINFLMKAKTDYQAEFLQEKARFICVRALNSIKEKGIDTDNKEIMEILSLLEVYLKLAKLFKLECVPDYLSYKSKIEIGVEEYLEKHGQHFESGNIDLSPIIENYKKKDDSLCFLEITHERVNGSSVNKCDYILKLQETNNLTEVFKQVCRNRSDKYPYYKQDSMLIFLSFYERIISLILYDNEIAIRFSNYLYIACTSVEQNYFNNEIKILDEYIGAFVILENIINLYKEKQDKSYLLKALENGCCLNLCGTIEKLLRNVLIKEVGGSLFINPEYITLAQILNTSNKLSDVSPGLRYFMEYYLTAECDFKGFKEEKPGKNIRNIQMHNRDDKYEKTNYDDALLIFFFALSLLGDLFNKTLIR